MTTPDRITRDQLFAALDTLGFSEDDRRHIARIEIDPRHIFVTRFKANDEGRHYVGADGEAAKEFALIEIS